MSSSLRAPREHLECVAGLPYSACFHCNLVLDNQEKIDINSIPLIPILSILQSIQ